MNFHISAKSLIESVPECAAGQAVDRQIGLLLFPSACRFEPLSLKHKV